MNTTATAQAGNLKDDVSSQFNKGAEKIVDKATDATHDLAIDMQNLKADMASIQQTLTKLASGAGNEAYKTAQNIGATVASQASDFAASAVSSAQGAVNSAQEQAKTFASELENRARANPLGTIGATLVVGIVIGMLSRGRRLMLGAITSAIDKVLKGQATRLVGLADDYKQRVIYEVKTEVKTQVVAAGVMAALVGVGLFFMMVAVLIGFAALYYWVALVHGPLMGLAAAGGAALVVSLAMFSAVAMRASAAAPLDVPPKLAQIRADARDALQKSQNAVTALASDVKNDIGSTLEAKARTLGRQTLDAATGTVRNGSTEALLMTVAATAVLGVLLGRNAR